MRGRVGERGKGRAREGGKRENNTYIINIHILYLYIYVYLFEIERERLGRGGTETEWDRRSKMGCVVTAESRIQGSNL